MKSALSEALNMISRRMTTKYQLKTKLCLKNYSEEEIEEAIIKLENWNYLNDKEYANVFCRLKAGKYSRVRVRQELVIAGIDSQIITDVLRESYSEETEYEYLKKIAVKYLEEERIKQTRRKDDTKRENIFQKTAQRLFRKGFSYNSIHKAIEELENNYNSQY
jgi:regulatory protein